MGAGRKQRRGGDLARVAEMVLVLAAAGEARGGQVPTPAERALAAEARGKLAAAVEEVARPRELVPREAVCTLVEDLGLGRARDCPRRAASISERVLLTKSKMEEVKGSFLHSTTKVPKTISSGAMTGAQQGASKSTRAPWNLSTPMTTPVILKKPLPDRTIAGASYVKPANVPSSGSLLPVASVNIKVRKDVNGSEVERGDATIIDQAKKSYHLTATSMDQNSIQSSSEAGKSLEKNEFPAIQPGRGSVAIGPQTPSGELSVHKQLLIPHHKEIATKVKLILYQPSSHPSWTVPSTEYMNTRLDCQLCKVSTASMENLIVCDACERGMHLRCLQRCGNQVLAETEWYCPPCLARSEGKLLASTLPSAPSAQEKGDKSTTGPQRQRISHASTASASCVGVGGSPVVGGPIHPQQRVSQRRWPHASASAATSCISRDGSLCGAGLHASAATDLAAVVAVSWVGGDGSPGGTGLHASAATDLPEVPASMRQRRRISRRYRPPCVSGGGLMSRRRRISRRRRPHASADAPQEAAEATARCRGEHGRRRRQRLPRATPMSPPLALAQSGSAHTRGRQPGQFQQGTRRTISINQRKSKYCKQCCSPCPHRMLPLLTP